MQKLVGNIVKFLFIIISAVLLYFNGKKVLPLKLFYTNILYVLSLVFFIFSAFSMNLVLIVLSFVFILIFFLIVLYLLGM